MSLHDALTDVIRAVGVAADRAKAGGFLAVDAQLTDITDRLEQLLEDTTPPRAPYRGAFTKEENR